LSLADSHNLRRVREEGGGRKEEEEGRGRGEEIGERSE
jgi:hypothetical protein